MRTSTPRLRLLIISVILAAGSILGGATEASAASPTCRFSSTTAPYVTSNPAIRASARVYCDGEVRWMNLRVTIYMLGGNCQNWCRVGENVDYWTKAGTPGYHTVTATTGLCAGTRQYYATYLLRWQAPNADDIDEWRQSYAHFRTCS